MSQPKRKLSSGEASATKKTATASASGAPVPVPVASASGVSTDVDDQKLSLPSANFPCWAPYDSLFGITVDQLIANDEGLKHLCNAAANQLFSKGLHPWNSNVVREPGSIEEALTSIKMFIHGYDRHLIVKKLLQERNPSATPLYTVLVLAKIAEKLKNPYRHHQYALYQYVEAFNKCRDMGFVPYRMSTNSICGGHEPEGPQLFVPCTTQMVQKVNEEYKLDRYQEWRRVGFLFMEAAKTVAKTQENARKTMLEEDKASLLELHNKTEEEQIALLSAYDARPLFHPPQWNLTRGVKLDRIQYRGNVGDDYTLCDFMPSFTSCPVPNYIITKEFYLVVEFICNPGGDGNLSPCSRKAVLISTSDVNDCFLFATTNFGDAVQCSKEYPFIAADPWTLVHDYLMEANARRACKQMYLDRS